MKKILHVFSQLERGGAEIRTLEFLERNYENIDFKIDILALSGKKGVLDIRFQNVINGGKIFHKRMNLLYLYLFLLKNKYDLIHCHLYLLSGPILFIAWFTGMKKRITHLRSCQDKIPLTPFRIIRNRIFILMTKMFSTHILSVSEHALYTVFGKNIHIGKKYSVVYSGFSLPIYNKELMTCFPRELSIDFHQKIIGHIGRFTEAKNHIFIANVYRELLSKDKRIICFFAGRAYDGNIVNKVKNILSEYINQGRIFFLGDVENSIELLSIANLLFFPSKWEGLPGVIIEALSCGVPVIASNIPPVLEISKYIKGLRFESIEDSIDIWVKLLLETLYTEEFSNVEIVNSFKNSPFYYKNSDYKILSIWNT